VKIKIWIAEFLGEIISHIYSSSCAFHGSLWLISIDFRFLGEKIDAAFLRSLRMGSKGEFQSSGRLKSTLGSGADPDDRKHANCGHTTVITHSPGQVVQ
jgi:hypothetical protein